MIRERRYKERSGCLGAVLVITAVAAALALMVPAPMSRNLVLIGWIGFVVIYMWRTEGEAGYWPGVAGVVCGVAVFAISATAMPSILCLLRDPARSWWIDTGMYCTTWEHYVAFGVPLLAGLATGYGVFHWLRDKVVK